MQVGSEVILFAVLSVTFNVLDSITTSLCFRQYPDKELKAEGNPLMRYLMLKSSVMAAIVKHALIIGLVVWYVAIQDIMALRIVAVALGIVVVNNSVVFVSRAVTKRKVVTPIGATRTLLHVPDKYSYPLFLILMFGLVAGIYQLVWRF